MTGAQAALRAPAAAPSAACTEPESVIFQKPLLEEALELGVVGPGISLAQGRALELEAPSPKKQNEALRVHSGMATTTMVLLW